MYTQAIITECSWFGQSAYALETQSLRLITVPTMGAKVVSIMDKSTGREWLLPPNNRPFKPVSYGAVFQEQDMSGWDEMFPTINACDYPLEGIKTTLPDHGEVWALPWQVDRIEPQSLELHVEGKALPYTLKRSITPLNDRTLRLGYEVLNMGDQPIVGLWAAHPQFQVDAYTRIVLPPTVKHVMMVIESPEWAANSVCTWPEALNQQGQHVMIDRARPAHTHACYKFYLPPEQPVTWAALQQTNDSSWIRLSWDVEQVPYLGVWVDEGAINSTSTIALEPATGYYDHLALAYQQQRVMHLMPHIPWRWHLTIECGIGNLNQDE